MEETLKEFSAWAPRLVDLGANLLVALLILVIGWWVSSLLGRWVRRAASRSSKIDPTIVPMFYSTVVWTVRIFTVIAVLARFGVQTASLIAVLGAAGLAVGLALQGTLQNIAGDCGFRGYDVFVRAFRRELGASPSEWRAQPTTWEIDAPGEVHVHPPDGIVLPPYTSDDDSSPVGPVYVAVFSRDHTFVPLDEVPH